MLLLESILAFLGVVIALIGFIFTLQPTRKTPIVEMKLLTGALLFQIIGSILFFPVSWFVTPGVGIDPIVIPFYKIAAFSMVLQFLCFQLSFYLPLFKPSYRHIFYLIFIVSFDSIWGFFYLTSEFPVYIQGEFLREKPPGDPTLYSLIGIVIILSMAITIVLPYIRIREIQRLTKDRSFFLFSPKYIFILLSLIILNALNSTIIFVSPDIPIPWQLDNLIRSFLVLVVAYGFRRNHHVFFLVPVKLHAIIITDHKTGLVLYAESFHPESPAEELLGMLLTSLNLSLKETIQSKRDMEEISFGDKVMLLATGKYVTSLFIASEKTLMTATLSRYLTKTFEKKFQSLLKIQSDIVNTADYQNFKPNIDLVRKYFAVSDL